MNGAFHHPGNIVGYAKPLSILLRRHPTVDYAATLKKTENVKVSIALRL